MIASMSNEHILGQDRHRTESRCRSTPRPRTPDEDHLGRNGEQAPEYLHQPA